MEGYWSEIATFLVTAGSSWGMITTKLKNQEKVIDELKGKLEEFSKDHDLIIRLDTKMDALGENLNDLKALIQNKRSKK